MDSTIEARTQQIYSLPPVVHSGNSPIFNKWSWWTDSTPDLLDYKSAALPNWQLPSVEIRLASFLSFLYAPKEESWRLNIICEFLRPLSKPFLPDGETFWSAVRLSLLLLPRGS